MCIAYVVKFLVVKAGTADTRIVMSRLTGTRREARLPNKCCFFSLRHVAILLADGLRHALLVVSSLPRVVARGSTGKSTIFVHVFSVVDSLRVSAMTDVSACSLARRRCVTVADLVKTAAPSSSSSAGVSESAPERWAVRPWAQKESTICCWMPLPVHAGEPPQSKILQQVAEPAHQVEQVQQSNSALTTCQLWRVETHCVSLFPGSITC